MRDITSRKKIVIYSPHNRYPEIFKLDTEINRTITSMLIKLEEDGLDKDERAVLADMMLDAQRDLEAAYYRWSSCNDRQAERNIEYGHIGLAYFWWGLSDLRDSRSLIDEEVFDHFANNHYACESRPEAEHGMALTLRDMGII